VNAILDERWSGIMRFAAMEQAAKGESPLA
jgi:hypothetical protein